MSRMNDKQLDRLIRRALKQNEEMQISRILQKDNALPDEATLQRTYRLFKAKRDAAEHLVRPSRAAAKKRSGAPYIVAALLTTAAAVALLAFFSPAIQALIQEKHEDKTASFSAGDGPSISIDALTEETDAEMTPVPSVSLFPEQTSTPSVRPSVSLFTEQAPAPSVGPSATETPLQPTDTPEIAPFTLQPIKNTAYSFKVVNNDAFNMVELYLWQDNYALGLNRLDSFLLSGNETTIFLTDEDISRSGSFHLRACFSPKDGARGPLYSKPDVWGSILVTTGRPTPKLSNWPDIDLSNLIGHTLVIYNGEDGTSVKCRIE